LEIDRLARSLSDLLHVVGTLGRQGVDVRSITEAIDTTAAGGRLIFHVFGALAEFERDLIRERTHAGLVAAAARGRKGGRKRVVDAKILDRARRMIEKGLTVREAASRLRIGKSSLYEAIRRMTADGTLKVS
jgi:DNA invertase Pin-like site-specific DNA recombinase